VFNTSRAVLSVLSVALVAGFSSTQEGDVVVQLMPAELKMKISRSGVLSEASAVGPAVHLAGRLLVQTEGPIVIEVLGADGKSLGFIPSSGDPVQFADRSPMAVIAPDTLVILDRRGRRLVFYSGKQSLPRYVRTESLDHPYVDLCSLGRALLLYRIDGSGAVHVRHSNTVGRQTLLVDSLWSPRPLIQQTLNDARLVCHPSGTGFALVGVHSPLVRWYSASGKLQWQHNIEGYRRIVTSSMASAAFRMSIPPGGYHALSRAIAVDSLLLLQLSVIDTTSLPWGGRRPLTAHVFETRSGRSLTSRGIGGDLLASEASSVWALGGQGLEITRHTLRVERDRR
jgi:hypothetical protein